LERNEGAIWVLVVLNGEFNWLSGWMSASNRSVDKR